MRARVKIPFRDTKLTLLLAVAISGLAPSGCGSVSSPTTAAASRDRLGSTVTASSGGRRSRLAGTSTTTDSPGDRPGAAATTTRPTAARTRSGPISGKGHWINAPTTDTGTFLRRRIWVPDDGSAPVNEAPNSALNAFDAPRGSTGLGQGNGPGFGEGRSLGGR